MDVTDLRIALFSGNYNYTRDGANQALNRLADYILRQGAKLRVYSPVVEAPDFEATGDLVDIPNVRMPVKGRGEYRLPLRLGNAVEKDLARFAPNTMHLSSPDPAAHGALKWARKRDLPVLASVHTRFETYPRYYGLSFLEPVVEAGLRRFYNRCDALVAPSDLGRALASGDIFFNPSITETFGNVTLEAMACGLPVVAAGATGAASLVSDGETGRLVPPSKTDAFAKGCAEALAPYCTDDALRLAHGAAGERAARAYSWDAINQAVIDTYLRLHTGRAAAGR